MPMQSTRKSSQKSELRRHCMGDSSGGSCAWGPGSAKGKGGRPVAGCGSWAAGLSLAGAAAGGVAASACAAAGGGSSPSAAALRAAGAPSSSTAGSKEMRSCTWTSGTAGSKSGCPAVGASAWWLASPAASASLREAAMAVASSESASDPSSCSAAVLCPAPAATAAAAASGAASRCMPGCSRG